MRREGKLLAWCLVAILVVGAVVYLGAARHAEQEADHNYANAIEGCHRANPRWRAYTAVVESAATDSSSPNLRRRSRHALSVIRAQPFVRTDGTTECGMAVTPP